MGTMEMKQEIHKWIEDQTDPDIIKRIYEDMIASALRDQLERENAIREDMIASALRAEEDIKAGRVYTSEEFWAHIKDYVKKR
jgi:thiamine kinase-like enzyme